jgi:hypothetical protein
MHPLDLPTQSGPLVVTLVYVTLYYAFQLHIARVKIVLAREYAARGEKFDRYFGQDRVMLAADRYQLNMLEHMPPFLALLWLHAVFVGPTSATVAGAVYVAARALYPLMMGSRLGRGLRWSIFVATAPGYLVLAWLAGGLVWALVRG